MSTNNAGIPSQCFAKEASTSPCSSNAIERPNPQPGHQSNPMFARGQSVK